MVAAHAASDVIPVKPDPGFIDDDDLPIIIKPVVSKAVAESVPLRPDPVLDELFAPTQPHTTHQDAAVTPAAMPHLTPQISQQAAAQTPSHGFSQAPLQVPDPTTQPVQQQQTLSQHELPASTIEEGEAGVKYNVFGIPIGPDEEPMMDAVAEAAQANEAALANEAAKTNEAIVKEAAKTAARTHPGLPAGFIIPDPTLFTLPPVGDHALFKARPRLQPSEPQVAAVVSQDATQAAISQPPAVSTPLLPTQADVAQFVPAETSATAESATPPPAPAKGKRGRKAKTVDAGVPEVVSTPLEPVMAPPESMQPPIEAVPALAALQGPVASEPPKSISSIVAEAAASAFGQLPAESISPLAAAASADEVPNVDEEGFIIQTFVEPAAVIDAERTLALPAQQSPAEVPPPQPAPPPPPWESPMQPPAPLPSPPIAQPAMQQQMQQQMQQPMQPPLQQPIQQPTQLPQPQFGQKPLIQQWAAQAKDQPAQGADPAQTSSVPISESLPPGVQSELPPVELPPATPPEQAPALTAEQIAAERSHDYIVGEKYQTGAGELHRTSWMEQGPTPNVSVPLPANHTPDKGPDVGTPVRKGPQRPQISPLYQEAFKSPLETPKIPPAPPPAPPSAPPSGTTGGVYNALDDNQDVPGMAQMPALPDDVDASGKKGKNVAWGGIKGGLSRGQRPDDAPVVHKDPGPEPDDESPFPEVAARPMLPTSQPPQSQASLLPPPQMPAAQHTPPPMPHPGAGQAQPAQSFAHGDDDAPHCPECSARLEGGSQFCGECGYKLGVRIPQCVSCQAPLDPAARFCGECGAKVADVAANGQNHSPDHGVAGASPAPPQADPEKAMEDYLSGFGPNQKDKHWSQKLKKILD